MRIIVTKGIVFAVLGLSVASCTIGLQQTQLFDALQKAAARSPKTISGPTLDQCVGDFIKYNGATFPEGRVATYSEAGVYSIVRYFPNDPGDISRTGNLVSYRVTITGKNNNPMAAPIHEYCYYANIGGKLRFLTSLLASYNDELSANYKYNLVEDIYERLTDKKLRIH